MKDKNKFGIILHIFLILIITLIIVGTIYAVKEFKNEKFESYYFYFFNGMGKSDYSMVKYAIKKYIIVYILIAVFLYALTSNIIPNKTFKYYPIKIFINHKFIVDITFIILSILNLLYCIGFFECIKNNISYSKIIDNNYQKINVKDVTMKKKKNLILIYIESLESTFHSEKNGGEWKYELLPEMLKIENLNDSTYFSVNNKKRGTQNLYGTTWTTAGVISSNSGIPFKIPLKERIFDESNILRGVTTLGDVLLDNGYHNEVISGASTEFGGLHNFFENHGKYEIIDADTIDKYNYKVDYDTSGRWGFNDQYMFDVAKKRILKHVEDGTTFNETLIGIDTHPINGEKTDYMINKYDNQYENSYLTEDKILSDFIKWVMSEDFYKDTTIVILGDHLCMQTQFTKEYDAFSRGRYNLFINSSVKATSTKNRSFTAIDLYPTILASIGGEVKNNKIGLGTNLFSDEKTITEKFGYDYVNNELQKNSKYYNSLLRE